MFWILGGLYLVGLEAMSCATFAWARWQDPGLGAGSGFWFAGLGTIVLGLFMLAFQTVGLFWSPERRPVRQLFLVVLGVGFAAIPAVGLWPFGQAALMRLALTGQL